MLDNTIFDFYHKEIIATLVVIILTAITRFALISLARGFGSRSGFSKPRLRSILKYVDFLIFVLMFVVLIGVWGVDGKQALLLISSIFTVIGVAMFAQWSVLSNITAGIIVFFSFPFKIGDWIRILDKDNPIEAEIIDIRSFYTLLRNAKGQKVSFPNNQLLQKGITIISKEEARIEQLPEEN